jgi:hypothetical protein
MQPFAQERMLDKGNQTTSNRVYDNERSKWFVAIFRTGAERRETLLLFSKWRVDVMPFSDVSQVWPLPGSLNLIVVLPNFLSTILPGPLPLSSDKIPVTKTQRTLI